MDKAGAAASGNAFADSDTRPESNGAESDWAGQGWACDEFLASISCRIRLIALCWGEKGRNASTPTSNSTAQLTRSPSARTSLSPVHVLQSVSLEATQCLSVAGAFWALLAQAEGGGAGDGGFFERMLANPLILPVGLLFIFYLTFIGPERRRKAEEAKMMSSLKKNDRVVTAGGIHGTIVAAAADSDVVTVRIDENSNTRIKLSRSAVARVLDPAKESREKNSGSAAKE